MRRRIGAHSAILTRFIFHSPKPETEKDRDVAAHNKNVNEKIDGNNLGKGISNVCDKRMNASIG